jgi:hypothetical protein
MFMLADYARRAKIFVAFMLRMLTNIKSYVESYMAHNAKGAFTLGVKDSSIMSPNTKLVI